MRFWDASAIVPLVMTEAATKALQRLAAADPAMLVWWATEVECASAIARLERDGALQARPAREAFDRLTRLADGWHEVDPSDGVREAAVRFLRVHALRAADALQLAAAFVAAERRPSSLELITLDDRLAAAARKEGFALIEVG
jgi:predicted nucleic acid-binding protein